MVSNSTEFTVDPLTDYFTDGDRTTLDLSQLSEVEITTGDVSAGAAGTHVEFLLAPSTTITANKLLMGGWNDGPYMRLGQNTVFNIDYMYPGAAEPAVNSSDTHIIPQSGLVNPTVTIRGKTGGDSRADLYVGGPGNTSNYSTTDVGLNGVATDARLNDFVIASDAKAASWWWASCNSTFSFDTGVVDAVTITLGKLVDTSGAGHMLGTLNIGSDSQDGGTLIADHIYLGENNSATNDANGDGHLREDGRVTGIINLKGGTILAESIASGGGTGTEADDERIINWYRGTIGNKSGTNLTIGAGIDFNVLSDSNHTFEADAGMTIVVNGTITGAVGASGINMTGSGTLGGTGELDCAVNVKNGAIFGPGAIGSGGALTVATLTMEAGSTFEVRMNGTADGQFGQAVITGDVTLGGELDVTLGYAPVVGDRVTIIDKQSSGSVIGQFTDQHVLAAYGGSTYLMAVFYNQGDGNDVALERIPRGTMFTLY